LMVSRRGELWCDETRSHLLREGLGMPEFRPYGKSPFGGKVSVKGRGGRSRRV